VNLKDPQQLYRDWEHVHWAAYDVDLSEDSVQWPALDPAERDLLHYVLSSLMVAEERISTQFCGLVLAADDEEETSYLASQLVDETRHMQFYARFQGEVVADPAVIGAHVARARDALSSPFRTIFDEALVHAHDRLRRDPGDREAKVDFVTIYHMVIEGTLGLVTSHFLLDALRDREILPGFAEGYSLIAADEQRHIAYGTWFLRDAIASNPGLGEVVRLRLIDLLPAVADAVTPPSDRAFEALGLETTELAAFGLDALDRRLKVIGVSLGDSAEQPTTG
jgi:ribonucleoside-diphosphate reductase beta chain